MKNARSIRQRMLSLRPALISDALGKSGGMDHYMQCYSASCRMAGPAFTLRVHTADILMVGKALSDCPPGHVLVIDGQGERNTALWGAITTECARLKRLEGIVIDGAIRDRAQIRRSRLPVFARGAVPNAGGAEYTGETGIPIQCGGAVVSPGDWIVSDEDGLVVAPAGQIETVLKRAEALLKVERAIFAEVRKGKDLGELLHFDELLKSKAAAGGLPQMRFAAKSGKRNAS
jgi:RraA family protein